MASYRKPPPVSKETSYEDEAYAEKSVSVGSASSGGSGNYERNGGYRSKNGGDVESVIVRNRVFVGGICPTANEQQLKHLFSKYGIVKSVRIVYKPDGTPKNFGFVTFDSEDSVQNLKKDADNIFFNDRRLNIAPAVVKPWNMNKTVTDSTSTVPTSSGTYVMSMPGMNGLFVANPAAPPQQPPPVSYHVQENGVTTAMYHGAAANPYSPSMAVIPAGSDGATYYQGGFNSSGSFVAAAPFQGPAIYYPVPHSGGPLIITSPYSSYPSTAASSTNGVNHNTSYVYSSPPPPPVTTTTASATTPPTPPTPTKTTGGASDGAPTSYGVPTIPPPPLTYAQPPYYGNVGTNSYVGSDIYYNVTPPGCMPVMMNGDGFMPYFEVAEPVVAPEDGAYEIPNYHQSNAAGPDTSPPQMPMHQPQMQRYVSAPSSASSTPSRKDSSPPSYNANSTTAERPTPIHVPPPTLVPPAQTYSEHYQEQLLLDNLSVPPPSLPPTSGAQTMLPVFQTMQPMAGDYSGAYYQQRSAAVLFPNGVYYNSLYVSDAATGALTPYPYPKIVSDFVSDHPPKREHHYNPNRYAQSRKPHSQGGSTPPPIIPKYPFNQPAYNGFTMYGRPKERDFQRNNGYPRTDSRTTLTQPPPQRPSRNNSSGSSTGSVPRTSRVFTNQNQQQAPRWKNGAQQTGFPRQQGYPRQNYQYNAPRQYEQQQSYYYAQQSYQLPKANASNAYDHTKRPYNNNNNYRGRNDRSNMEQSPIKIENNNNNTDAKNNMESTENQTPAAYKETGVSDTVVNADASKAIDAAPEYEPQPQRLCTDMQKLSI